MIALYHGKSLISWRIKMGTLSDISHASWLKTSASDRAGIRSAINDPVMWRVIQGMIIDLGCIEAWHNGGVRSTGSLREGHTPGTRIDIYDLPEMTDYTHRKVTDSLEKEVGKKYWFKGIMDARLNRFMKSEPPMDEHGRTTKFFCSHLIEEKLRLHGCPTTDEEIPSHGVWPGSLKSSVMTRKLGTVVI